MSLKKEPIVWYFVLGSFLAVIVEVVLLITQGPGWILGTGESSTSASDTSTDEESSASVDEPTPYVRDMAQALSNNPVWIDPLIAGTVGRHWIDESVRSAIAESSTPVYVVVLPEGRTDGSNGSLELTADRLVTELDREGVFYVLSEDYAEVKVAFRDRTFVPEPGYFMSPSSSDLAQSIGSVDSASSDSKGNEGSTTVSQIWMGLLLGVPWLVVGWFVSRWIARAARRNTNYLEGFGA